jgi:hypothetical protein
MAKSTVFGRREGDPGTGAGASGGESAALVRRAYFRPEIEGRHLAAVVTGQGSRNPDSKAANGDLAAG